MALRKENIEKVNNHLEIASSANSNFEGRMSECESALRNDENYQLFIQGTEIGRELDEKLQKLIAISRSASQNEVANVIKLLKAFVDVQEGLNNTGL